jgi:hypothetical protein
MLLEPKRLWKPTVNISQLLVSRAPGLMNS